MEISKYQVKQDFYSVALQILKWNIRNQNKEDAYGGDGNHFFNYTMLLYVLQSAEIVELSLGQYQELCKRVIKERNKLQHLSSLEALDEAVKNCQLTLLLCPSLAVEISYVKEIIQIIKHDRGSNKKLCRH
jgi:hypothetical protein